MRVRAGQGLAALGSAKPDMQDIRGSVEVTSVLIDTSVWMAHSRSRNDTLIELVQTDQALNDPMVVLELACGTPAPRAQTLDDIGLLRPCNQVTLQEVRDFIEREALHGLGCGLVDMSLLASSLVTRDARL